MTHDRSTLATNRLEYEARYERLLGTVPVAIRTRWELAERFRRGEVAALLEELRGEIQFGSYLDLKTQQLIQFAQLLAIGKEAAATLHARAAIRAGASLDDLLAVAETSLLVVGVAGYVLGFDIIQRLASEGDEPVLG